MGSQAVKREVVEMTAYSPQELERMAREACSDQGMYLSWELLVHPHSGAVLKAWFERPNGTEDFQDVPL